jgi:hypothetical protein
MDNPREQCVGHIVIDVNGRSHCDVMMSFYDEFSLMTNKVQKNSNQILEGKVHCKNVIGIEIPTVKLQENRGGIMSTDVVFGKNQDRQI